MARNLFPSMPDHPSLIAFAFGLSLFTGVLFGTAPAWFTSHGNPVEALRGANRSTRDSATLPQKILVVVQATLSIVLLAGAGLLTRSLRNLEHQSFGFETDHRISIVMNEPPASYTEPQLDALYREFQPPGANSRSPTAALALYTPYIDNWGELIVPEGHGVPQMDNDSNASWDRVSPGYPNHGTADPARAEHQRRGHQPPRAVSPWSTRPSPSTSSPDTIRSGNILAWICRSTTRRTKS